MFADIGRTNRENIVRRIDLYIEALASLRDAIAADDPGLKQRLEQARTLHQDWLSGRAQGIATDSGSELPSNRSLLAGGLLGGLGTDTRRDSGR
jgi:hypothetical protein